MPFLPVDVLVTDTSPTKLPVSGVMVKVLSLNGKLTYTSGVTGDDGLASMLLESGQTYQLRFYKFSTSFKQPKLIEVREGVDNSFEVKAERLMPPTSPDPRLCMAYGHFRTITGAPAKYVEVMFISKFSPIWLEGSGVLTERQVVRTDEDGYVQVPLIRFGQFDVTIQGYEDLLRTVYVPDAANVNLPDLLWPIVSQIVFEANPPPSIAVGEEVLLPVTVYASDGQTLTHAGRGDVLWSSSDASVLSVSTTVEAVRIYGNHVGTASIQAQRRNKGIIHIPDKAIQGVPVEVAVL